MNPRALCAAALAWLAAATATSCRNPESRLLGDPYAATPPLAGEFGAPMGAAAVPGPLWEMQPNGAAIPPGLAGPWPAEEYIHDGGDRHVPAALDGTGTLVGLESQDAVALYHHGDGVPVVTPSNEVALYAPRFASVRNIVNPAAYAEVDQGAVFEATVVDSHLADVNGPVDLIRSLALEATRTRSRPSLLGFESFASNVMQSEHLGEFRHTLSPYENVALVRAGLIEQSDEPLIALGIQAAVTWTSEQFPVVAARVEGSSEVVLSTGAQEIVVADDLRSPGNLRLVKLASTDRALPGEIVEFTLRYDNTGGRAVHDVVVFDSLVPRLEYVPDTAQSDRPAEFHAFENEDGSLVLEWLIEEPLEAGQGGVVRFQARVR